jgi:hypothetical protein
LDPKPHDSDADSQHCYYLPEGRCGRLAADPVGFFKRLAIQGLPPAGLGRNQTPIKANCPACLQISSKQGEKCCGCLEFFRKFVEIFAAQGAPPPVLLTPVSKVKKASIRKLLIILDNFG